jgi:SAM-dependent methyltransferase
MDLPSDMSRYYAQNYYSFIPCGYGWKSRILAHIDSTSMGHPSFNGRLGRWLRGPSTEIMALQRLQLDPSCRILDVGCGVGNLVLRLTRLGFNHVSGIDPFLDNDRELAPGVFIRKQTLTEAEGQHDVIMLHHSFEHMADPDTALKNIARLLAPGGTVILRLPMADSYAWRTYGPYWVNLDAPRHIYLHTRASLKALADRNGFEITQEINESDHGVFWMSERYRRGRRMSMKPCAQLFLHITQPIRRWWYKRRIRDLNRSGQADCRCYYLRRQTPGVGSS